jgi:hypothetical protein
MMEMYHNLLKWHNCNLNKCVLYKIGLSEYDIGLRCGLGDIGEWVWP